MRVRPEAWCAQRQHAESAVASSCAMRFAGSDAPAGCRAPAHPSRTTSEASAASGVAAARFPGPTAATATGEKEPSSTELRRSPTTTSGCARPAARARAGASCAAAAASAAHLRPRPRRRLLLYCSALLLAGSRHCGPQRRSRRRRIAARTCGCRRPHAFVGGAHLELLRAAAPGMQHRQQASCRRGAAPAAPRRRRRTCSVSVASSSWSSPALIKQASADCASGGRVFWASNACSARWRRCGF